MKLLHILFIAMLALPWIAWSGPAPAQSPVQEKQGSLEKQKTDASADSSFQYSFKNTLSIVGIVLTHHALRNSRLLHDWPFFAAAAPAWSSSAVMEKNFGHLLSFKGSAMGNLSAVNLGVATGVDMSVFHLLELGVRGFASSAWNYGSACTFMGNYNPEKGQFNQDFFMTEGMFSIAYKVGLSIPLMVFLPKSDWTKIILKGFAQLENSRYTGARDGEAWKVGADVRFNGYRGEAGGSLMYMLPFNYVRMLSVTARASGFLHDDFDPIYEDYDPEFVTVNITPMLMFRLGEKWSGMAMAPIVRERKYANYSYDSGKELLQKRTGAQWKMNTLMVIFNRSF